VKTLVSIFRRACVSGSWASLVSTAALALAGTRDCRSAFAPVNAVSHWLWKDRALGQDDATLRYTVSGYAIHHVASIFWACFFESLGSASRKRRGSAGLLLDAGTVSVLAAAVDLRCTPERLTPGFERRLTPATLTGVYAAFGIGLAACALAQRAGRRCAPWRAGRQERRRPLVT